MCIRDSTNTVSTTVKPLTSQVLSQPQPAKQEALSFRPSFIKQKQEELAGQPLCQERGDTSAQEKEMVTTPCDQSSTQAQTSSFWLSLHPLGQINAMYIVANGEDGLYLVDQHAAHERIRFESYRQAFQKSAGKTTQLVLPQQLALTYQQKKTLLRSLAAVSYTHLDVYKRQVRSMPKLLSSFSTRKAVSIGRLKLGQPQFD